VPQAVPAGQLGAQQVPPLQVWPGGQAPLHTPPQPSGAPHAEAAQQLGRQVVHRPPSQREPGGQRPPQSQVPTQAPPRHT